MAAKRWIKLDQRIQPEDVSSQGTELTDKRLSEPGMVIGFGLLAPRPGLGCNATFCVGVKASYRDDGVGTTASVASATLTCKLPAIYPNSEIAVRQTASTKNDALLNLMAMRNAPFRTMYFFALRTRFLW